MSEQRVGRATLADSNHYDHTQHRHLYQRRRRSRPQPGGFDKMVCLQQEKIKAVDIADAVRQMKAVDPQGELARPAHAARYRKFPAAGRIYF